MAKDYLSEYIKGDAFDIPRLINDDFFKAIKLLFNGGLYVSSAKLLLVCIDSLSYVAFGDTPGSFKLWLDTFVSMEELNANSSEIWELRNSLLHMTNLDSRMHIAGGVRRTILCANGVGPSFDPTKLNSDEFVFVDLKRFIDATIAGIERWLETYKSDPTQLSDFVMRYDKIVSDVRLDHVALTTTPLERQGSFFNSGPARQGKTLNS